MAAAEQKLKTKKVPGLRVTASTEGFRRAGRAWSKAPTEVPASEFTKAQIAALKAETMLMVADIEIEVAADGETKPE